MGGFDSGAWADVMTRKVNTGLCRTLSVKTLKMMGAFDADRVDEVFCIRWFNEFGDDACKSGYGAIVAWQPSGAIVKGARERSLSRVTVPICYKPILRA